MTAATFRKRPVEVTAVRWAGDNEAEMVEFAGHSFEAFDEPSADDPEATASLLTSRHSHWALMHTGDWAVKTADGGLEYWPEDRFAAVFEPVAVAE